jgi:predicted nucleic acid-binding Zn ribbon protein
MSERITKENTALLLGTTAGKSGDGSAPVAAMCEWTNDIWDESETYETDCGHAFVLMEADHLSEHGFKFCVYCGKPIKENRVDKYAEEELSVTGSAEPAGDAAVATGAESTAALTNCVHCGRTLTGYIEKGNGFCSELVLCNYRKRMTGNKA